MNWLLRNDKWVYYGLVALAVPLMWLLTPRFLSGAAFASIYGLLLLTCLMGGSRLLSRAASRGMVELYRDCDPGPMLANCDALLRGARDGCSSGNVLALRADRVTCLMALGRLDEAEEELDRLERAMPGHKVTANAVVCRGNRIALNLARRRTQGLELEIEAVRAMLCKTKVPSMFAGLSFPELVEQTLEKYSCSLLLQTAGPIPQLEGRLQALMEAVPCTLYQVQAAAELAEYYLARGEKDSAAPYLRLVARDGGKLAVGRQAKEKLARMGG